MQGITGVSGGRYAPSAARTSFQAIHHQASSPPSKTSFRTDEFSLSLAAGTHQVSSLELTTEVSSLQAMMETLKSIETKTDDLKLFAEELVKQRKTEDFGFDSNLDLFTQIMDYLEQQVKLLLGQAQAKENDLITRMQTEIALDSSHARDLASHAGEQLRAGLNIILGIDTHERARVAALLR
ncbi:hypothetical protein ACFL6U_22640 [Planctomycetota bacterium]